jgi:multidrug efflux pump subunit AcrB
MRPIEWFAKNRVAANLIMVVALIGGAVAIFGLPLEKITGKTQTSAITQEVFPEFSLDLITVTVLYLGAAPSEVEEGVCVRVEEAVQGLDGIKEITSSASEGVGVITIKLTLDADSRKLLDEIKARVDAIDTFPEETEKPVITELTNRREVINVALYGDADESTLRALAEQVRDEISNLPGITLAELASATPFEVSIEVSESAMRRHGLSLDMVADAVRRSSLDLPGGAVKTAGGEILLRTKGQAYSGREFEELVLLTRPDGTHLLLGDVATIIDGFADTDRSSRFNGQPAMLIQVFRIGDQSALGIADAVSNYIVEAQARMPQGITLTTWNNMANILRGRRDLLIRNGIMGLVLVFTCLALFLRFRLAFWVAVGLAISFMGTFLLMPALDVSINLISLFAFILVLGIVVDDAIVVGENIYTHQHRTGRGLEGAINGAREVGVPVIFAVLTTVAAFAPLLFIEGSMGKVMSVIPMIVIPCLLWSLVESMWVLPAHLSHYKPQEKRDNLLHRFQAHFANGMRRFIDGVYSPTLEIALRWRYLTIAIGIGTLLISVGLVKGGFVKFFFFPAVEADFISAALEMPPGTPAEVTSEAVYLLERGAEEARREVEKTQGQDVFKYTLAAVGDHPFRAAQHRNIGSSGSRNRTSNLGELTIELLPGEDRNIGSETIADIWRAKVGPIPDAINLDYTSSLFSSGEDINIQLTGHDLELLRAAATEIKERLAEYPGAFDISDSFREGKQEIKLTIKPEAELLGLKLADLARQVRQAFYGEEAQRIQRGRDDVRIMVRYPEEERRSLADLENMRIRMPDGAEVPFSEVAVVDPGRGYSTVKRVDRRRAVNVTADVDPAQATPGEIIDDLRARVLPEVLFDYPGINYTFEGQQAEQRDTMGGLIRGFALALLFIFALLAIPLRSYMQALLIMMAIPFGIIGAVWGHALMGVNLTIMSMFGVVALAGVVVNDSLVMVDFINRQVNSGGDLAQAIRQAGVSRFRPILLTSLTTFAGLSPLMLEKSMQAKFLIPMAISLAFGVIFATPITLILVPSGYLVLADLRGLASRGRRMSEGTTSPKSVIGVSMPLPEVSDDQEKL